MVVWACLGAAGAGAQTVTIVSPNVEDGGQFGYSVSPVPDINGDGKSDLLAGSYNETVNGIDEAGRAYIRSGVNGAHIRVLTSGKPEESGHFGNQVAGMPDFTGDALGDVAVAAINENNGTFHVQLGTGRVYLFNGATGQKVRVIEAPNNESGGYFGFAMAGCADITGDGKGDLIVGAPFTNPGNAPQDAGRAYIFNGATGAIYKTLASPQQQKEGVFGSAVASVPDMTGDGKPEVVIGALGETSNGITVAGRVHLFNGATGTFIRTFNPPAPQTLGFFGLSVAPVADVNGDGACDILVGAPWESPQGSPQKAGRAHLFSGATGVRLRTFAAGAQEADDEFGYCVAGLDDINGDGKGDVAIGSPGADPGGAPEDSGRVFVFSGASGGFLKALDSPNRAFFGEFGGSIAAVPDVNGNGKGECLVGADEEPVGGVHEAGRVYLFKQ
jgi:hypothetical protein